MPIFMFVYFAPLLNQNRLDSTTAIPIRVTLPIFVCHLTLPTPGMVPSTAPSCILRVLRGEVPEANHKGHKGYTKDTKEGATQKRLGQLAIGNRLNAMPFQRLLR